MVQHFLPTTFIIGLVVLGVIKIVAKLSDFPSQQGAVGWSIAVFTFTTARQKRWIKPALVGAAEAIRGVLFATFMKMYDWSDQLQGQKEMCHF